MSEPAKDEAELLHQVAISRCECQPGGCYALDGGMYCHASEDYVASVISAIRAAGWAVVPGTQLDENARLREALQHAEAAMEGMASDQLTAVETANLWNATMESIRKTLAGELKP